MKMKKVEIIDVYREEKLIENEVVESKYFTLLKLEDDRRVLVLGKYGQIGDTFHVEKWGSGSGSPLRINY
jgi:hypothetical protein